jgi:hypothetical protein
MTAKNFQQFCSILAGQVRVAIDQLIQDRSNQLLTGSLERSEFRRCNMADDDDTDDSDHEIGSVSRGFLESETGEAAVIETSLNMIRVSLKIKWDGPDGCVLSQEIQNKFFTRLGRSSSPGDSNLPCLRREPIKGYDISFIFTDEYLGSRVESFLLEILPVWRCLTKTIRINQVIGHTRSGRSLFDPFSKAEVTQMTSCFETEEVGLPGQGSDTSILTECGDSSWGRFSDVDAMIDSEIISDQFLIN